MSDLLRRGIAGRIMSQKQMILTTWPDRQAALDAAGQLVRDKLAACAQVLPAMTSVYEWRGEAHNDEEYLMLIKTTAARYAELEASLRAQHPYEVPEIVAVPIQAGLEEYLEWIDTQTKP